MNLNDEGLKDSNWQNRRYTVKKLAASGTSEAIDLLIQALGDVHDEVARLAVESLVNIGTPAVPPLITTLLEGKGPLSNLAGEPLAQMGAKTTLPLTELLPEPRYTARAANVLSRSADTEAVPLLISFLTQDYAMSEPIIRALGSSRDRRATYPLLRYIEQYGASPAALLALGEIADPRSVPLLIEELKGLQRWFSARALGQIGEGAVDALIEILNQDEYNHQGVAAYALGLIPTEKTLAALAELAEHPDRIVAWQAAAALLEMRTQEPDTTESMRTLNGGFTLTLSPTGQYFYATTADDILCLPDMNRFLRTPVKPPFPLPCLYSGGKTKPEDFISLNSVGWLISDRIKNLLTTRGFTGWDTYPVQLLGKNAELIQGYQGLLVTGKIGATNYARSQVQLVPNTIVGLEPDIVLKGLSFADNSWDGSDFFLSPDSTRLIVTEPVIEALSNLKPPARNWIAEPLVEVKRSIKFEKDISFLTTPQKELLHGFRNILKSSSSSGEALTLKAALFPETDVKQLLDILIKKRCLYQADKLEEPACMKLLQDIDSLGQSAVDELLALLLSPAREYRAAAAWVLGQLKIESAVETLIDALAENDDQVQSIIIGALGRIGDRRYLSHLIDIFTRSESEHVRSCAAEALGRLKDPQAVTPLLNALRHEGSVIVLCALADALASLGDPAAAVPLINLYDIGDGNLDAHLKQALIKLGFQY